MLSPHWERGREYETVLTKMTCLLRQTLGELLEPLLDGLHLSLSSKFVPHVGLSPREFMFPLNCHLIVMQEEVLAPSCLKKTVFCPGHLLVGSRLAKTLTIGLGGGGGGVSSQVLWNYSKSSSTFPPNKGRSVEAGSVRERKKKTRERDE